MKPSAMHKILSIRLTDPIDQVLLELVKTYGMKTRSRLLRMLILEAGGRGPILSDDNVNLFREGVRQLAAIGNNINQIARAVNSGQAQSCPWPPDLMNVVLREIAGHRKVVADIVVCSRTGIVMPARKEVTHE